MRCQKCCRPTVFQGSFSGGVADKVDIYSCNYCATNSYVLNFGEEKIVAPTRSFKVGGKDCGDCEIRKN